ncbi:LysR family transcriptional regulator [Peptacetobacter hiranonis]|uniref:LysR family transcriptional regulator n=1 Tax=Peptacetobacter hiranonis TaxID=89152 RepID=UPI0022E716F1|nr:LysR family transcriptional regulator [Peptacetobacter hiranonis]
MDINTYKIFVTVAETNNISYTAEVLGYTQSGVSHSMKRLEKELGLQLFIRDRYGVHLTPIGRDFLQKVRALMSENEKLEQFIYNIKGLEVGSLNIGALSSISVNWLPDIINNFNIEHPNITINLKEGGISDLYNWVSESKVDFAFSSLDIKDNNRNLEFLPISSDKYVAILPNEYNTENMNNFPISKFNGENFILPDLSYDNSIFEILKKENSKPIFRFSSQNDYSIISMVENGLGLSILPELAIKREKDRLKYLPLEPSYNRKLGIYMKKFKDLSPAAKTFIYFVASYFDIPYDNLKLK